MGRSEESPRACKGKPQGLGLIRLDGPPRSKRLCAARALRRQALECVSAVKRSQLFRRDARSTATL
eukprot:13478730-Heterocapsa_arctica.AAC.1